MYTLMLENSVNSKPYLQSHSIEFDLSSYKELCRRINIARPTDP